MKDLAICWCNETLNECSQSFKWIVVLLGGSVAKGYSDNFSDIDLCIICPHEDSEQLHKYLLDTCSVVYSGLEEYGKHITVSTGDHLLDIHLTTDLICGSAVGSFLSGQDISNVAQDFLWNLCHGITCFSTGDYPTYSANLSKSLQVSILQKYLPLISTHKLSVYSVRSDTFQQWETLTIIGKTLVNIGYAMNGQLFKGYKNIQKQLADFPPEIRDALSATMNFDVYNWENHYESVKLTIGVVRDCVLKIIESQSV